MKKALVIGAGPAGLTAAYELLKKSNDIEVTVFEESSCFGGISKTVVYKGNIAGLFLVIVCAVFAAVKISHIRKGYADRI